MKSATSKLELVTWTKHRLQAKALLESQPFELVLCGVIVFNLALMVVETDFNQTKIEIPGWMDALNHSLLAAFTLELMVRLYVYRFKFFKDPMSIIDAGVVGLDLCSTALEFFFSGVGGFSVLRILRLLRLSRATLIVEKVPELSMLARSLIGALKPIFWGSIVLVFLFAVWGVLAVQFINPLNEELDAKGLYFNCERCPRAYNTVWHSSLTMMQQIIAGDSWGMVTLPIIEHYPSSMIFFVLMFITLEVALMNVVLACVVDSAAQARVDDLSGDNVKRKLTALCEDLDDDNSGEITFTELKRGFKTNREFKRRMGQMDIHEQEIDVVWDILDADKSGTIQVVEFVDELSKLKKANAHTMLLMIRHYVMEIRNKINQQLLLMRQDLERAEKQELEIAEQMRREEHELNNSMSKLMRSGSCSFEDERAPEKSPQEDDVDLPPARLDDRSDAKPSLARPRRDAGSDLVEEKMNTTKELGYDAAFMAEQRQFMADMMASIKDLRSKIEVCMPPPLPVPGEIPEQRGMYDQSGMYDQRRITRDMRTFDLPNTRPGLPVSLWPFNSACGVERGSEREGPPIIVRPVMAPPLT
jgi:voltage-gated sodium channel